MENISFCASSIVEFKSKTNFRTQECIQMLEKSTETVQLREQLIDAAISIPTKAHQGIQTDSSSKLTSFSTNYDEQALLLWLRKIMPIVEKELPKGSPPIYLPTSSMNEDTLNIQPYQRISLDNTVENSILLIAWLSKDMIRMPILVTSLIPPHMGWCEHDNECIKLFIPQRRCNGKAAYSEENSLKIHINNCLLSLRTNSFQKNMFYGSTYACDICIWKLEDTYGYNKSSIFIKEVCKAKSPYGVVIDMDWLEENCLLTVHANARIVKWELVDNNLTEKYSCLLHHSLYVNDAIQNVVATGFKSFVLGTKNGLLLWCSFKNLSLNDATIRVTPLRNHIFSVTSLLKYQNNDEIIIVSCDLSGQVYYHNLSILNVSEPTTTFQLPLPFKNAIQCSNDGTFIYYADDDGSLECYNHKSGKRCIVKSGLAGAGSNIKLSENTTSHKLIALGPFKNIVQIFSIDL